MLNSVPIPTDNVFKFYALFSLVLFIFCGAAELSIREKTYDVIFSSVVEIATLKQEQNPSKADLAKIEVAQTKMDTAIKDSRPLMTILTLLLVLSLLGMAYGFRQWHVKVQSASDKAAAVQLETSKVQLETARLQLAKLKAEIIALNAKD